MQLLLHETVLTVARPPDAHTRVTKKFRISCGRATPDSSALTARVHLAESDNEHLPVGWANAADFSLVLLEHGSPLAIRKTPIPPTAPQINTRRIVNRGGSVGVPGGRAGVSSIEGATSPEETEWSRGSRVR